jgi:hypothetical protein
MYRICRIFNTWLEKTFQYTKSYTWLCILSSWKVRITQLPHPRPPLQPRARPRPSICGGAALPETASVARESVRRRWRRDPGYVSLGARSAWPGGICTPHFVGQENENERHMRRAKCTDVDRITALSRNWYSVHVQHIPFCEVMRVDCGWALWWRLRRWCGRGRRASGRRWQDSWLRAGLGSRFRVGPEFFPIDYLHCLWPASPRGARSA